MLKGAAALAAMPGTAPLAVAPAVADPVVERARHFVVLLEHALHLSDEWQRMRDAGDPRVAEASARNDRAWEEVDAADVDGLWDAEPCTPAGAAALLRAIAVAGWMCGCHADDYARQAGALRRVADLLDDLDGRGAPPLLPAHDGARR
jgi:hypothetical protein